MPVARAAAASLAVVCAFLLPAEVEARKSRSPMVDKINKVRKAHGVRPARYSGSLSRSSSRFARYIARTHRFTHGSRIMASGGFSELGEVLALTRGWEVRRSRTLAYWLQSRRHRAVLLSPAFRYVGAARTRGHFGGSPTLVWAVQFGR